jgi:hypothetical protein
MNEEKEIMQCLVEAWDKFILLPQTHPDHQRYFRDGIHACQQVLMWKELQKDKSKIYPIIL